MNYLLVIVAFAAFAGLCLTLKRHEWPIALVSAVLLAMVVGLLFGCASVRLPTSCPTRSIRVECSDSVHVRIPT